MGWDDWMDAWIDGPTYVGWTHQCIEKRKIEVRGKK